MRYSFSALRVSNEKSGYLATVNLVDRLPPSNERDYLLSRLVDLRRILRGVRIGREVRKFFDAILVELHFQGLIRKYQRAEKLALAYSRLLLEKQLVLRISHLVHRL